MSSIDDRVFECECGHIETGQAADDCRYHGIVHWTCECKDCDFEDCEACEAAGCEEFECCHECEAKYDELEAKRQHLMTLKEEQRAEDELEAKAFGEDFVHWTCECKDCDFEHREACEAARAWPGCCHECEEKFDKMCRWRRPFPMTSINLPPW
jgi:hypothetical protein